jgi:uncharacterized membrane protein
MNWFLFWLFLHILAAVIAFGPIFVFPIVGTLVAKMPQHLRFAVELNHRIELRLVLPLAVSMFVSGVGLIWTANINVFGTPFLLVGIILYLIAMAIAVTILVPTTGRLVRVVEHAQAAGAAPGAPPPEVMALIRRNQMFGGVTTVIFLLIIFLMVVQPGGLVLR